MASTVETACFTFLFAILATVLLKLRRAITQRNAGMNLPPGPWSLPVIGSMHHLLGSLPHHAMQKLSRRYGPVMLLQLGHVPTVVLSSPEAAREVMKTHDVAFASRHLSPTASILTYGARDIVFSPYDKHLRELRKLATMELLSPKCVRSFRHIREEEAVRLARSVDALSSDVINISERMKLMMNDIIMRVSIGDRCPQQEEYLEALDKSLSLLAGFNLVDLFPTSRLARMLGGRSLRTTMEGHEKIHLIMNAIIQDREIAMKSKEPTATLHVKEDVLDVLLRFQRDGGLGITLTSEIVNAVLWDVFAAGSETTSTTTIWAMTELMKNPRVMERAQLEIRLVLQGKNMVCGEDIEGRVHYLQLVIKEVLRLHPPVPLLIPRVCSQPSKVMGYDIPQGSMVLVNVWALGRDEKNWTDANEFKPERFEDESVDLSGKDFRFLPGGAGRRMCPGLVFGVTNIEIALASLLYHFDWKLPRGADPHELDMTETDGVTAQRKTDLLLEAIPYVHLAA